MRARSDAENASRQSRTASAIESTTSTAVGFVLSWALTPTILLAFGYQVGAGKAFGITVIYTVLSLLRGYGVRRVFNWLAVRS